MRKSSLNTIFVDYIHNHVSPLQRERDLVTHRYEELSRILVGENFKSGSYARFTAITPINDLDVIWIVGSNIVKKAIDPNTLDLSNVLSDLAQRLRIEYQKLGVTVRIKAQSHSVGIYFGATDEEFSIDVVPAIPNSDLNEFGEDTYFVPEILRLSKAQRIEKYAKHERISWIRSDPKGYIKQAQLLNIQNEDFRRATKFVKRWKHGCRSVHSDFSLKSFHLELIVTKLFLENPSLTCYEAICHFFFQLPDFVAQPQIIGKADSSTFTDEYIRNFDDEMRHRIKIFAKAGSQMLENIGTSHSEENVKNMIGELLSGNAKLEREASEEFLFDHAVPVAIDPSVRLSIDGEVLIYPGFRSHSLKSNSNTVFKDRRIKFYITNCSISSTHNVLYQWKVKNNGTDALAESSLRGEITNHSTRYNPESTKYIGNHYVECYAIVDGICVAKDRQIVNIINAWG